MRSYPPRPNVTISLLLRLVSPSRIARKRHPNLTAPSAGSGNTLNDCAAARNYFLRTFARNDALSRESRVGDRIATPPTIGGHNDGNTNACLRVCAGRRRSWDGVRGMGVRSRCRCLQHHEPNGPGWTTYATHPRYPPQQNITLSRYRLLPQLMVPVPGSAVRHPLLVNGLGVRCRGHPKRTVR